MNSLKQDVFELQLVAVGNSEVKAIQLVDFHLYFLRASRLKLGFNFNVN